MKKSRIIASVLVAMMMLLAVVALVACTQSECDKNGHQFGDDNVCTVCGVTRRPDEGGKPSASGKTIKLVMWAPSNAITFYTEWANKWAEKYEDSNGNKYEVTFGVYGEGDAATNIEVAPEDSADVFCMADDQVARLSRAGILASLGEGNIANDVKARNSAGSVEAASYNGQLLAYPMQADNGYYLYYNSKIISDEQAKTWDGIFEAVNAYNQGKSNDEQVKVQFDYGTSWYQASWFFSFGGTVSETATNFADAAVGQKALQAAYEFSARPYQLQVGPDDAKAGLINGSIAAAVVGGWIYANDGAIKGVESNPDVKLTILPKIKVGNEEVQMKSFLGCKLIGVNAQRGNVLAAHNLANYLTSETVQIAKAKALFAGPSNINAAADPEVMNLPTVRAIAEQAAYSVPQINLPDGFWDALPTCLNAVNAQGTTAGDYFPNGAANVAALQTLLDSLVTNFKLK